MPVFRLKIKIQYLPKTRNMKPQQNTSLDLKCQKKKTFFSFSRLFSIKGLIRIFVQPQPLFFVVPKQHQQ